MKIVFTAKGPGGNAEAALNALGTAVFYRCREYDCQGSLRRI